MLKSAELDYGYANDDVLSDVVSSFTVFAFGFGEILGLVYTGFISDLFGIENSFNIAASMSFLLAFVFAIGSGVISLSCQKKPTLDYTKFL